ncbi:MAG: glycosyltransferase [bacterium]
MNVALVHDYLNQFGGAERVLLTLTEMFPDAPIYTLFHDNESLGHRFNDRTIYTSFLDKPLIRNNHRYFIPLFAPAACTLNLGKQYDLIISDSAGFGKGVRYKNTPHISYIHSPLRYAWEPEMYLGTLFSKPILNIGKPLLYALRHWDKRAAQRPDIIFTNSHYTREKINNFYARDADVLYPPVNTDLFFPEQTKKDSPYYLAFGRIIHYKRFDLIVDAFNILQRPLLIIGDGPEKENIKKRIRSPYITMHPMIEDENELRKIISNAKAFIFPQEEDFGLVAAEAITCGTPVIAYGRGGALEIVQEGINGTFFYKNTPQELAAAVERYETQIFNRKCIIESAYQFSKNNFKEKIFKTIKNMQEFDL